VRIHARNAVVGLDTSAEFNVPGTGNREERIEKREERTGIRDERQ
jgi:hypothetical protein